VLLPPAFDPASAGQKIEPGGLSVPDREALGEHRRETGSADLGLNGWNVVLRPAVFNAAVLRVVEQIGRSRISIPRLADRAGVDQVDVIRA
jgi:hypothetical protein